MSDTMPTAISLEWPDFDWNDPLQTGVFMARSLFGASDHEFGQIILGCSTEIERGLAEALPNKAILNARYLADWHMTKAAGVTGRAAAKLKAADCQQIANGTFSSGIEPEKDI